VYFSWTRPQIGGRPWFPTFSRTLGAGLRLGCMVVPKQLAGVVAAAKGPISNGSPWLEQAALAGMMRTNSYAAHLVRLRAYYKQSRDALLATLRLNFGELTVSGVTGGLHMVPSAQRPGCRGRGERGVTRTRRRIFVIFRGSLRDAPTDPLWWRSPQKCTGTPPAPLCWPWTIDRPISRCSFLTLPP
jgi:hypothetical protein